MLFILYGFKSLNIMNNKKNPTKHPCLGIVLSGGHIFMSGQQILKCKY